MAKPYFEIDVVISNSKLNTYGFRVLTEGVSLEQYNRNPVLLFMHCRAWEHLPLGTVKNVRKQGDDILGTLSFDGTDEMSRSVADKYKAGTMKAVSGGFDIVELSEDASFLLQGQTRPTVSKSSLNEVSCVDIGANNDALVAALYKDGKRINLSAGDCELPLLSNLNKQKSMNELLQKIALALGLPATAAEPEVLSTISAMTGLKAEKERLATEVVALKAELVSARDAAVVTLVDDHLGDNAPKEKRDHLINLGKTMGAEELRKTIAMMTPAKRPSDVINNQGNPDMQGGGDKAYVKLSEVPANEMEILRKDNRKEYVRLYKAEYGFDPEFND
jgi:hypothetical protein